MPDLEGLAYVVAVDRLVEHLQPRGTRVVEHGVVGQRVLDGAVVERVERNGIIGVLGSEGRVNDVTAHWGLTVGRVLLLLRLGEEPLHNFPCTGRVLGALGDDEVVATVEGAPVAAVLARQRDIGEVGGGQALFLEGAKEPVVSWQHADVALAEVLAPCRAVLGLVSGRCLFAGPNPGIDAEE